MALLNENSRVSVWEEFMRENKETISVLKLELRETINAIDQWTEDNAASFNAALPIAFRTTATPKQKALVFLLILAKRFRIIL